MYSVNDLQKLVQMLAYLGISPGSGAPAHSVVLGGSTNAAPGVAGTLLASNGVSVDPSFRSLASLGIQPLLTFPLTVAQGGTGLATLPAHNVLLGAGTGSMGGASPGVAGLVLVSNGAAVDPSFQGMQAGNVFYSQGGAGSVILSVAAKFSAEVSIDDFGANGAADASIAANAALTAATSATTGRYAYAVTNAISIGSGQTLYAQPGSVFNYSGSGTLSLNSGGNYFSTREGGDFDTWYWGRNRTGTHTTGTGPANLGYGGAAFNFEVHRDDMNVGTDFSRGIYSRHIFGGSNKQGGVFALLGEAYHQGSATSASNGMREYIATGGNMHIQSNDGGTGNTFALARGAYFGMAAAVYADAPATNVLGVVGMEIDVFGVAAASCAYTTALNLVNFSVMTNTNLNAALTIGSGTDPAYGTSAGWPMGICFSDLNGNFNPMTSNATLIGYTWVATAGQRTVLDGINFSGFTFTDAVMQAQYSKWTESSSAVGFGGKSSSQVINFLGSTTTATAPGAGGAGALPATPRGYWSAQINGTAVQFPFY